ncbi:hypothetical protein GGS24DRAFT_453270 [Hypoxylon argillaceum]|nr:hypothetical protein GGS24DRAFT_453270 [Hypoxylon argillaceum]
MVSSSCLKLEARRVDGAAIKVSVHLKNLRKPGDIQGTATAAAAAATSSSGWS